MAASVQPDLESRVQAALQDLRYNRYPSVRRAANAHSLSVATLARRYNGGGTRSSGQTTNQLLTTQEEAQLVQWLTEMTDRNIPARVNMINSMAGTIFTARQDGSTTQVGTR